MKEITKWNYEYINNKELQDYLNYIKQFEVLKKEEQINLFNKYQKGDKNAFKKLINHNLGLSVTIAKTFIGSTTSVINIFDLINEGNLALINAVKSFNPEKDVKFSSYAGIIIKQQLTKYVLENKKEISLNGIVVPTLINYVPDTKYDIFVNKYILLDNKVKQKISEIKYDPNTIDEDRFFLYMNDGNYVYITLTKMELLNKYNDAITKFEGKKGTLYLDSGNYFEIR